MASNKIKGDLGEEVAADYVTDLGFTVLERNYRYKRGEIDIIAKKNDLLVFFEVKARHGITYGYPEEAVDDKKIEMVIMAANNYIFETEWDGEIRFDIIALSMRNDQKIMHFEDAFY